MNKEDIKKLEDIVFALESIAHLQHRERELLPLCDEARIILDKLKRSK